MMYWRVRRRPEELRHIVGALIRSVRLFVRLRIKDAMAPSRPTLTIALTEHLGDIVAAEPVARAARERFPSAPIRWVVRSAYRSLPDLYDAVDETIPVGCLTEWLLAWSFGLPGTIWDLHLTGRACPHCQVILEKRGAASAANFDTYYRLGNLLTTQCISAGIAAIGNGPQIPPDATSSAAVNRLALPEDYIVVHCASNDVRRDWTTASWIALTQRLMQDHDVFVVEIGLTPVAVSADGPLCRGLCGQSSLLETAEVIRRARLFVGLDSGPAHLANAVRTPAVLLMGPFAGFERYMPYSGFYENEGGAELIWGQVAASSISVDTVLQAVLDRLREPSAQSPNGSTGWT